MAFKLARAEVDGHAVRILVDHHEMIPAVTRVGSHLLSACPVCQYRILLHDPARHIQSMDVLFSDDIARENPVKSPRPHPVYGITGVLLDDLIKALERASRMIEGFSESVFPYVPAVHPPYRFGEKIIRTGLEIHKKREFFPGGLFTAFSY